MADEAEATIQRLTTRVTEQRKQIAGLLKNASKIERAEREIRTLKQQNQDLMRLCAGQPPVNRPEPPPTTTAADPLVEENDRLRAHVRVLENAVAAAKAARADAIQKLAAKDDDIKRLRMHVEHFKLKDDWHALVQSLIASGRYGRTDEVYSWAAKVLNKKTPEIHARLLSHVELETLMRAGRAMLEPTATRQHGES